MTVITIITTIIAINLGVAEKKNIGFEQKKCNAKEKK